MDSITAQKRPHPIKQVVIIGSGVMGKQIALHVALHSLTTGQQVTMTCQTPASLQESVQWVEQYLASRIQKGRMTAEVCEQVKEHLQITTELESAVQKADLIIEAIIEDIAAKRALFAHISSLCRPDTILATNSSNIVSSRLADVTQNPARLLNMHFFNPALVMELVEIVQGDHTNPETTAAAKAFVLQIEKIPVVLNKEIDGFIVNRINAAVTREACSLLEKGIASFEDIDLACEKGLNYPMGPFRLMDLIGIDVLYCIRQDRYSQTHDPQDAPSAVITEKYQQGEFGRKTGKGWYSYPEK